MPELLSFKYLTEFVEFVEHDFLHDYLNEFFAVAKVIKLPLLTHFKHLPDKELLALCEQGLCELFAAIANNNLESYIAFSNNRWLNNKLPVVARNDIAIDDFALYNYARKKSLLKFIRAYTNDADVQFALIEELDKLFLALDRAASRSYVSILKVALLTAENKLEEAQEIACIGSYEWIVGTKDIKGSKQFCKIFDWDGSTFNIDLKSKIHPEDAERVFAAIVKSSKTLEDFDCEFRIHTPSSEKVVWSRARLREAEGRKVMTGTLMDVTERSRMDAKIRETEYLCRHAQAISHLGNWKWTLSDNSLWWSDEMYNIYGVDKEECLIPLDTAARFIHPDDLKLFYESAEQVIREKEPIVICLRIRSGMGEEKTLQARYEVGIDPAGRPFCLYGTVQDVTQILETEKQLEDLNRKLQQSNANLQDFAHVVSHDLKEPLRKVIAFGQMLAKSERDRLSPGAQGYVDRMVNASERMQRMIDDILALSLISHNKKFEWISLQQILEEILQNLEHKIEESKAVITYSVLPSIEADPSQFRQLFQNLISNSLKFRSKDIAPYINITAVQVDQHQKIQMPHDTGTAFVLLSLRITELDSAMNMQQRFLSLFSGFTTGASMKAAG